MNTRSEQRRINIQQGIPVNYGLEEITQDQLEDLEETLSVDRRDFNSLLEEYTGIVAKPYTGFVYYDSANNWVGDSDNYDVREILKNAYITIKEN